MLDKAPNVYADAKGVVAEGFSNMTESPGRTGVACEALQEPGKVRRVNR